MIEASIFYETRDVPTESGAMQLKFTGWTGEINEGVEINVEPDAACASALTERFGLEKAGQLVEGMQALLTKHLYAQPEVKQMIGQALTKFDARMQQWGFEGRILSYPQIFDRSAQGEEGDDVAIFHLQREIAEKLEIEFNDTHRLFHAVAHAHGRYEPAEDEKGFKTLDQFKQASASQALAFAIARMEPEARAALFDNVVKDAMPEMEVLLKGARPIVVVDRDQIADAVRRMGVANPGPFAARIFEELQQQVRSR